MKIQHHEHHLRKNTQYKQLIDQIINRTKEIGNKYTRRTITASLQPTRTSLKKICNETSLPTKLHALEKTHPLTHTHDTNDPTFFPPQYHHTHPLINITPYKPQTFHTRMPSRKSTPSKTGPNRRVRIKRGCRFADWRKRGLTDSGIKRGLANKTRIWK